MLTTVLVNRGQDHTCHLRKATVADVAELSAIAWAAKAHWGYPAAWLESWRPHLTITGETLAKEVVWLAEQAGEIVGFFSLRQDGQGWHLEHLWVKPAKIGQGIGRFLVAGARRQGEALGAWALLIISDPSAEAFYKKMGAKRIGLDRYYLFGTTLRELPVMKLEIPPV